METAGKLKEHYVFTEEDEQNLLRLKPFMETEKLRVGDELYRYILSIPEISPYLSDNDEARKRHRAGLGRWFSGLFSGRYDRPYFLNLQRIGATHVRIELKGHYVNAAMNLMRGLCGEIVNRNFVDPDEREELSRSLDKILDMNLDVITGSYREAE